MGKENKEIFRDSIATIAESGQRNFIFPKKPKGKLYNYRSFVSWFLLAFMILAPFIKIKGNQFLLFNVLMVRRVRKLISFNKAFTLCFCSETTPEKLISQRREPIELAPVAPGHTIDGRAAPLKNRNRSLSLLVLRLKSARILSILSFAALTIR